MFGLARKLKVLLSRVTRPHRPRTLVEGIADATGLETRYVSRYFAWKKAIFRPNTTLYPAWPKLSILCHSDSHLIVAIRIHRVVRSENIDLIPLIRESKALILFERVLADRGYDSERNHRVLREELGIRSVIIPPRADGIRNYWRTVRGKKRTKCHAPYRRRIRKHFPKLKYRNRCQVESVFSRLKRHLGSALQTRNGLAQLAECRLRVLIYNLMLLAAQ